MQLVANAGCSVSIIESGSAEQQIPQWEEHGEVAAAISSLEPSADRMVRSMKARAHQQPLAQRTEAEAQVGMRQVLDCPRYQQNQDELCRRHPDQQRDRRHPDALDQIVEKMVAAVRPEAHLALAVVHAV